MTWKHSLAFGADLRNEDLKFHLIMNAYWEELEFALPRAERPWRRWIDTSLESPNDIADWQKAPPFVGNSYPVGPRSVVALFTESERKST